MKPTEKNERRVLTDTIAEALETADIHKLRFIFRFVIRYLK